MTYTAKFTACVVVGFLFSVLGAPCRAAEPEKMTHAKNETGVVSLDVYGDGPVIHLLLARRVSGAPPVLEYLRSGDSGATWSAPVTVGAGQAPPEPAHRGADAQIAASGNRIVAVWTTGSTEDRFGRGPMACAYSGDGGKTWTPGANPADDGQATGHAFIDVAADSEGAFHLVWLDGRADSSASLATTRPAGKGLRYARSTDGGASWSTNQTLDPQTCECCWNTIRSAPGGKIDVLYRGYAPRDMAVICSFDNGRTWTSPVRVGDFNWTINGCPHVGGALAIDSADPMSIFAVVWTAKDDVTRGAYTLSSSDGGGTWSKPVLLGNSKSWHPDIARRGRDAVAVWDAYTDDGTAVYFARSVDSAATWSFPTQLNSGRTSATHPRVISTAVGYEVFWTEQSAGNATEWKSRHIP